MSHKQSCRACGSYLLPISHCTVCKEYISWICNKCEKMEDVTHTHDYCRVIYREVEEMEMVKK